MNNLEKSIAFTLGLLLASYATTAQSYLYGTTSESEIVGGGVIFRTDSAGNNFTKVYQFDYDVPGAQPDFLTMCLANNGKYYGVTPKSGKNDYGILFEFDPVTNSYSGKVRFDGSIGREPYGGVTMTSTGKLYGTTKYGGANDAGTIFVYDVVTNSLTTLYSFALNPSGNAPVARMTHSGNGKLYGSTIGGGSFNSGVIYEFDPSNNMYQQLCNLPNGNLQCSGPMVEYSNGKLYGMSRAGGSGDGTIFEFDKSTNTFSVVSNLNGTIGRYPLGGLVVASNNKLYGLAQVSGTNNGGTILELDPATNSVVVKYNFASDGRIPCGTMIQASNGKLYGTTGQGGVNNVGVVFEYDYVTDTYTRKVDFNAVLTGSLPIGGLVETNGKLYGLTKGGGINIGGTLFEYDINGASLIKKFDLNNANIGRMPCGGLMEAPNGKIYGMSNWGGANNRGTIYEFDKSTNICIKKADFEVANNGRHPYGRLSACTNGKLYGMAYLGGVNFMGTIVEFDPATSSLIKKIDFAGSDGDKPVGSLLDPGNGKLYGLTINGGGGANAGVLFEYNPSTNTVIAKHSFTSGTDGSSPYGSLIKASNGKLYGVTVGGGTPDAGIIFEYDYVNDIYTKKTEFWNGSPNNDGTSPYCDLVEGSNSKLYGMASITSTLGVKANLFEYDLNTAVITDKIYLSSTLAATPEGTMIKGFNGKFYGYTKQGGTSNSGVMFEYDPATNIYTKKVDFTGSNGKWPRFGQLLRVYDQTVGLKEMIVKNDLRLFPNPTNGSFEIEFGKELFEGELEIYDMFGKKVFSRKLNGEKQFKGDLNAPDGMYLVIVRSDNKSEAIKMIVNH